MNELSPIFNSMDLEAKALLLERAARLREKREDDATAMEDGGWVAEFSLGGQAYALPLEQVVACQPLRGVAAVPLGRPGVIGILRFQGKIVRVLSLASLLGSRGWRRDPSVLLILRTAAEELAVDCEEIPRVGQLPAGALAAAAGAKGEGLVELSLPGGRLLRFLNLEALLLKAGG
jgi:chemotaxis signal transduction protein